MAPRGRGQSPLCTYLMWAMQRGKNSQFFVPFRQEISDAYNRDEEFPENHMTTDDAAKLTVKQVR